MATTKWTKKNWTIAAGIVAVVLVVVAGIALVIRASGDDASAAQGQPSVDFSTTTATTATTKAPTTKQVQAPSKTQVASEPPTSTSTQAQASVSTVPNLPSDQAFPPATIQGLNFLIDGRTWVSMDPSDSMDGGMNRMTKVNLMPAKRGPECDPSVSTRLCQGFVVVDADQAPFYTEGKCLTIGGPSDPTYKFAENLGPKAINGLTVERQKMTRCDAAGVSYVWTFSLPGGDTKVMVFEVGNDSNAPLPGLEVLLSKVTVAPVG